MDGLELIAWAVKRCEDKKLPPNDANILMFIRGCVSAAAIRSGKENLE